MAGQESTVRHANTGRLNHLDKSMSDERIKEVVVRVMPPNGKTQRRVWKAPDGQLFAAEGIKRILEAVFAWATKEYPPTKFVCVQMDVNEFHFMPQQAAGEQISKTMQERERIIIPN
jgi:hypothetical protein